MHNQGIWIYSDKKRELLNIENNNTLNYTYPKGWTLAGTNKELNATIIKCDEANPITWKYKNHQWKVYYKEKKEFTTIEKNSGFWVGCF